MKRKLSSILGLFLTIFATATLLNSCEVDHTYEAEITVINPMGVPVEGVTVKTEVDLSQPNIVGREGVTNVFGKVNFDFDNVAILKVRASLDNASGEGLLVLEEDEEVKLNVVIYE